MAATVVANTHGVAGNTGQYAFEGRLVHMVFIAQPIQVIDIGLVVTAMVDFHRQRINMGLERSIAVWQLGQ